MNIDGGNEDWGFVIVISKISKFYCVKLILQFIAMINAKEKTTFVLFLEHSSLAKVAQKWVAPNALGILQENICETLIF